MIPKKIHYVWFGDKDFGEIEKKCMETWHKVLPEYEIVRWGNDCIDKFDNRYFREAIAAKPLIVRWAVWYAFIVIIFIFAYTGDGSAFIYANF